MMLLVTTGHPQVIAHLTPSLGRLVQPRHYSSIRATASSGIPWAADNDCFQGLDAPAYFRMLDALVGLPGCLFVTVPDVVADPVGTIRGWVRWSEGVRRRGLPIGFVAQDGCDLGLLPQWWLFDALFIGGSTEWKLGHAAARLVAEAKARGKWVHMGRVNTIRRLRYAHAIGCDSVDGSKWARWRSTYLDGGLAALDQPQLAFGGVL